MSLGGAVLAAAELLALEPREQPRNVEPSVIQQIAPTTVDRTVGTLDYKAISIDGKEVTAEEVAQLSADTEGWHNLIMLNYQNIESTIKMIQLHRSKIHELTQLSIIAGVRGDIGEQRINDDLKRWHESELVELEKDYERLKNDGEIYRRHYEQSLRK